MPADTSRSRVRKTRFAAPAPKPPHTYDWWLWSGRPSFEGACDALAAQYAVLDEVVQPLLAGGWGAGPRLDRWRVAARLAQLTTAAEEVVAATRRVPVAASGLDAVDWYRQRSAEGAEAGSVAGTAGTAGAAGMGRSADDIGAPIDTARVVRAGVAELALRHRRATALAIAVIRSGEPELTVGGPAAGIELAEFAVTRLAAAVVHGLDLGAALGRPGHADRAATNLVSGFLAAVAERGGRPGPAAAPIAVDGHGSLITLTAGRHKTRIPAVEWIQAATATGRRPADRLLPRTHAWLAAELPLVA